MTEIEPDPRTDGVGDGGRTELPPPSAEEIAAGVEYDRQHRRTALSREEREDEDWASGADW